VNSTRITTPYDDLTYKIIGCAMSVHRAIGPGLRENIYHRALEKDLSAKGLAYISENPYAVYADINQHDLLGYYVPDFVVEEKIVVEIKALNQLDNTHLAQVIGYLSVTNCPIGLLINFGERSLRYRRVFPSKERTDFIFNHQWLIVPNRLKSGKKK
jgi:GxxExxY protein